MAAQFSEDAVQGLEEFKLVLEDHHPQGDAEGAFGNEFVGRRSGEHGGLLGTLAAATVALTVIAAAMGANIDFQDIAIGAAGNFLIRLAAIGTAVLIVGQRAVFVRGGQVIVRASAMSLATGLLSTATTRGFLGRGVGIGRRLGHGGSFGFAAEEATFQLADFTLQEMVVLLQLGFALDGPSMLCPPKIGLQTQFDELQPQAPQQQSSEKEEPSEFAKASPQQGQEVWFRIVGKVKADDRRRGDVDQRSLLRGQTNQRIGGDIHAPPMVGREMAPICGKLTEKPKKATKPGKLYGRGQKSRQHVGRMFTQESSQGSRTALRPLRND
jgi:hypothetical protein